MSRPLALLSLAALLTSPVAAQTIVRPDPQLDSTQTEIRNALVGVRDSVIQVQAAVAQVVERGPATASDALLRSRSRGIAVACEHAAEVVPDAKAIIARSTWESDFHKRRQGELLQQFDRLSTALGDCATAWRAMSLRDQVGDVRTRGVARGAALRQATLDYQLASDNFLKAVGIRVRPRGAGPSPLD